MHRTPPTTVTPVRLWRWRRNPLRRHSDIVEAWVVLTAWILAVLGGVAAGWAAAHAVESGLAARRAHVHAVSAVLADAAPRTPPPGSGYDDGRVWATVRWTSPDGTVRTDRAKVLAGAPAGSPVTVWTDGSGRTVHAPDSAGEAMLQTVLTGTLVAQLGGATVWAGGWVLRTTLVRRRLAEWDAEWRKVGPEWRNLSGGRG
ncbi:hypothetical protein [Streptomyces sp. NPDC005573]|uniref:Rv1733c family protein n=1 Tax=unclassified Streptomyces TaxID=2593676 RepID=UPI0033B5C03D